METGHKISFIIIKKYYTSQHISILNYPGSGSEKEKGKFNNILNIPLEAWHDC